MKALLLAIALAVLVSTPVAAQTQSTGDRNLSDSLLRLQFPGDLRLFTCKQPLPEFTLGPASNPSEAELAKLCACVWSKLPEGGWEREVAAKIRRGEDPGWRGRGFIPRFGAALDACGGRTL